MKFIVLPSRLADAATNMADDLCLLYHFPEPAAIRFRHYEWTFPCWTFGYGQRLEEVRDITGNSDICRRPTGGGLVQHSQDWTYSLVIPTEHPIYQKCAAEVYHDIHEAMCLAFQKLNVDAVLVPCRQSKKKPKSKALDQCFKKPDTYDIVFRGSRKKLAGAAQKRTQAGMLIQGTVDQRRLPHLSWRSFEKTFAAELAQYLGATLEREDWPYMDPDAVQKLRTTLSDVDWNEKR